ncbi:MAG: S8 family peptidase [Luteolibacter sp.]
MPTPLSRSRWLIAVALCLVLLIFVCWPRARRSSSASGPQNDEPAPVSSVAHGSPATAPTTPSPPAGPVPLAWTFADGGRTRPFTLALDEVVIRDAAGEDRSQPLSPPATSATYRARIASLSSAGTTIMPVVYPDDETRTAGHRRLVTANVLAEASGGIDRTTLPSLLNLAVESVPEASPHHIVLRAATPLDALDGLENWRAIPGVAAADVELAHQQAARAMPNDSLVANQWHLKYQGQSGAVAGTDVNIESVWNYPSGTSGTNAWRGTGVRIGIVDDGLQTAHPDLSANYEATYSHDWNGNDSDPNPSTTGTVDKHGTSCAGNAAARGNNGTGVSGTAPEATLTGMRLIAAATTDSQEADAMGWHSDVIAIKTNSWGPTDDGETLEGPGTLTQAALANATANGRSGRGTIFTWAGGNGGDVGDNSNYDGYANSIHVIAIGAFDSQARRSYYSEPGANLICVAPSSGASPALGITTVDRTGTAGYNTSSTASGGDYTSTFGGTSSATPTTAGIVALMLQRNPNLGWRDVREILIRSSKRVNPTDSGWVGNAAGFRFHHDYGAGLIDATAAVNLAATWVNLPANATPIVSPQSSLNQTIPDNNATGITRSFVLPASGALRVEHVTVKVNISHTYRGDLAITLTSPSGVSDVLAALHDDPGDNYTDWTFSSVRHWGESSAGTWTLKIADLDAGVTGTLNSAELTVRGTTPSADYAAWTAAYPGLSDTSATADPDHDGLPNLVEYHLGLAPNVSNTSATVLARTSSQVTLTWRRQKGSAATGHAEWSDNLVTWATTGITETVTEDNANDQLVTATLPITSGMPRKFLRLHVTL